MIKEVLQNGAGLSSDESTRTLKELREEIKAINDAKDSVINGLKKTRDDAQKAHLSAQVEHTKVLKGLQEALSEAKAEQIAAVDQAKNELSETQEDQGNKLRNQFKESTSKMNVIEKGLLESKSAFKEWSA